MKQRFIQSFPTSGNVQTSIDSKELGKPYVAYVEDGDYIDWNTKDIDYENMPLTLEVLSAGTIVLVGKFNTKTKYEYQINDNEIVTGETSTQTLTSIDLNAGDIIKIRGFLNTQNGGLNVSMDDNLVFNIYGNIASLGSEVEVGISLARKHVISAKNLIIKNKYFSCDRLFSGCTALIEAPAVIHATSCSNMFYGCTSLTTAPELPATTLTANCYYSMFQGCTSLTQAPELPATALANNCYRSMFFGCTSLTKAPELPATTLANGCYNYMFYGCTGLNYIKCLATDLSASNSTYDWVLSVPSTGTFVKAAGVEWSTGTSGIPRGWTVQEV